LSGNLDLSKDGDEEGSKISSADVGLMAGSLVARNTATSLPPGVYRSCPRSHYPTARPVQRRAILHRRPEANESFPSSASLRIAACDADGRWNGSNASSRSKTRWKGRRIWQKRAWRLLRFVYQQQAHLHAFEQRTPPLNTLLHGNTSGRDHRGVEAVSVSSAPLVEI
jgi:hypothetical protein